MARYWLFAVLLFCCCLIFLMKLYNFQLLLLLTMFSMRKHISFLVALFQESSACLSELPILYLQPVLSFLLLLAFYIFWISVIICLATASSYFFSTFHRLLQFLLTYRQFLRVHFFL